MRYIKLFKNPLKFAKAHKIISIILIAVLAVAGIALRPKAPTPIDTQTIKYADLAQTVSVTGNINSQNSANLSFQTGGKLVYLSGKVGDSVYKGQIIASLDKTILQANLRQAQQDFNAAQAAVAQVYDQTKRATDLTFAQNVSQTAAEATQNKAYDNTRIITQQLANSDLVSPVSGIITREDVTTIGANVSATSVFGVADNSAIIFSMDVDEGDIGKVQVGQTVSIILDAFTDKTISTAIATIDPISHTTSTGGNAYTVKTEPLINDENYRIGMNGDADIIIAQKNNVLTVSNSAIFDNNKVYIKQGNKFIKKTIDIGLQNDTDSEVLSGLSEGDTVVLEPSSVSAK